MKDIWIYSSNSELEKMGKTEIMRFEYESSNRMLSAIVSDSSPVASSQIIAWEEHLILAGGTSLLNRRTKTKGVKLIVEDFQKNFVLDFISGRPDPNFDGKIVS